MKTLEETLRREPYNLAEKIFEYADAHWYNFQFYDEMEEYINWLAWIETDDKLCKFMDMFGMMLQEMNARADENRAEDYLLADYNILADLLDDMCETRIYRG